MFAVLGVGFTTGKFVTETWNVIVVNWPDAILGIEKPIFGSAAGSTVLLTITLPGINTVPSAIVSVKRWS